MSASSPLEPPVRVLVVDDSALVRKMLTDILSADPRVSVVGTAPDAAIARDKIKALSPDVITLDVEMPGMNGIDFLERLMRLRPMPVVMISTLTQKGADTTLRALELGAVDYVSKPTDRLSQTFEFLAGEIVEKVLTAGGGRVRPAASARGGPPPARPAVPSAIAVASAAVPVAAMPAADIIDVVGVGASTGGVEAIGELLAALPAGAPGILIVQHMPAAFIGRFAARLNAAVALTVTEAEDGAPILPGTVRIGGGGRHLTAARDKAGRPVCRLIDGGVGEPHVPSADALLGSLAAFGDRAIGVLLTGMGRDGVAGLKRLRDAGGLTIAQDAATSVVYGMPRAAVEAGAVGVQLPLPRIPAALIDPASHSRKDR